MLSRFSIIFVFIAFFSVHAHAQVGLDTGLFIGQPDFEDVKQDFGLTFSGDLDAPTGRAGVSIRVGKFLFGLETLRDENSFRSGSMTGFTSDGGSMSSGFMTSYGPEHRAIMGVKLFNNVALYGFHGLAGYSLNHELAYNNSENVSETQGSYVTVNKEKTYYRECGRSYTVVEPVSVWQEETVSATHSSFGYNYSEFDGLRNSMGAGLEAAVLGGVLRFEYNLIQTSGFTQTVKLNHTSSNARLRNNSDQESVSYTWNGSVEQLFQLRWKTEF